ncbi:MAG: ABC transporter permease [archaeon]
MFADFFKIAFRNLSHRRMRSWLTMIGIFIGIAAVVALISLGQGLESAITSQFTNLGSDKLTVQARSGGFAPPGSTAITPLTTSDVEVIEKVRGADLVIGRLLRPVKIEFKEDLNYGYLISMPEGDARTLAEDAFDLNVEDGRLLKEGDSSKVVIGADYADASMFDREVLVGDRIKIQGEFFEVVGILKKEGNFMVDGALIMNTEPMRDLLDVPDEVDIIAIQVDNVDDIDRIAEDIERKLRKHRGQEEGKEDFTVQTPQQMIETLTSILLIIQVVIVGIAGISLLVGGVGITNTMYTAVLERRKEIGIMKAIGAKNKDIASIFMIEAGLLGMAGGAIGVGIGIGLAKAAEFAGAQMFGSGLLVAEINPIVVIGALLFAYFIGTISGVSPAMQAAKMNPVDALSYAK